MNKAISSIILTVALSTGICSARDDAVPSPESTEVAEKAHVNPYAELLQKHGVEPTPDGVIDYLKRISPTQERIARVDTLIEQLGASNYWKRHAAQTELKDMGLVAEAAVTRATDTADPELAVRARHIHKSFESGENANLLYAVLKTISLQSPKKAAPVLAILPLCKKPFLLDAATETLCNISGPDDRALLTKALKIEDLNIQSAALAALTRMQGEEARAAAKEYLKHKEPLLRLTAAQSLANVGERDCLPVLVALLGEKNLNLRLRSADTLRRLTKMNFNYAAYDKEENRAKSIEKWQDWLKTDAKTAELKFPLKSDADDYLHGHTLIAKGYKNEVIELDGSGKVVWKFAAKGAWSAEKMANGNVLITAYAARKIIEVNMQSKVVWEYPNISSLNAKPLPNGNVLIADYTGKRIIEVRKSDNKIVWEHQTPSNCSEVQRLPNGNTLFSARNLVREINRAGKTVWEYDRGGHIYGARRIKTGNTLVSDFNKGKVYELSPDKRIVWEFAEPNPTDAFRLPNGNTLITSGKRAFEVTADKEVIWEHQGTNYGTTRR